MPVFAEIPKGVIVKPVNKDHYNCVTSDGFGKCDINACRLAIKLININPKVVAGFRMKSNPNEWKTKSPHFWVEIKDKVWDFSYSLENELLLLIWDKETFYEYDGVKVCKQTTTYFNMGSQDFKLGLWKSFAEEE